MEMELLMTHNKYAAAGFSMLKFKVEIPAAVIMFIGLHDDQ